MSPQPGNQLPRSGPETPTPPSTASSFAKQELLPAAEKKENAYPQHFCRTKTRLLATLNLGVHIMVSLTLTLIGWEVMYSGTEFTIEVLLAGIWGFIVCGLIGVIIAHPDSALTDFLIGPIAFSMIGFVLNAMAFSHMGTHMSFMPEHDIRGYPPDLVFSGGIIFWASSTLLQSMLYTFLFTYGRMIRPLRAPQKDFEKGTNGGREDERPKGLTLLKGADKDNQDPKKLDPKKRRGLLFPVGSHQPSESSSTVGHHRSPSQCSWKTASEAGPPLSPRQRTVSLSNSRIYQARNPRPHAANHPQSVSAGHPVPIIHCTPSFYNSENSFNPNMGLMRPISVACQSTTTVSDMSERSVSMAVGDNDARSLHRASSTYSYDHLSTADLNSNRASVVTFIPAPGQLNMHPTRSYEMVVKDYASNPDDIVLKVIPEEFRRRHDIPPNDAQCLSYYHMQPHHHVPAQHVPPQFGEPQGQQRVPERRVVREIPGQHMALNNFKFGGRNATPATPTARHQALGLQHPQRTIGNNMDMQIPGGHFTAHATPYAPVAGSSKPRTPPEQTPMFDEGDNGMIPAFVYGGKPAGAAMGESELEKLNFMC
ncbi:hypothetical protein EV426DRAFT_711335 [Tirmania nivea]|nr:hypothetical protein EV426DRAFT_711335 [Tirmania nivea]